MERRTELVMVRNRDGCVHAVLKKPDGGEETCVAQFLAGCDGARSAVRHQIGVRFPGGTYEHVFYVADVDERGPVMNGELHLALDDADFLAAHQRLLEL